MRRRGCARWGRARRGRRLIDALADAQLAAARLVASELVRELGPLEVPPPAAEEQAPTG